MLAGGPATPTRPLRSLLRSSCRWPLRLASPSRTCAGRCGTWPRRRRPSPTRSPAGSTVLPACGPCGTWSVPPRASAKTSKGFLRLDQGLKLRRKTELGSMWDPGDELGVVRRTLDFSGNRTLLKAGSVELRVEDVGEARCEASLTADLSNQRGEYLSLAGILGATLAVLFVLAGMQSPLFFLGVLPALAAPVFGFRFAYGRGCREIRRSLDDLLDAVEVASPSQRTPRTAPTARRARYRASNPSPGSPRTRARRITPEASAAASGCRTRPIRSAEQTAPNTSRRNVRLLWRPGVGVSPFV